MAHKKKGTWITFWGVFQFSWLFPPFIEGIGLFQGKYEGKILRAKGKFCREIILQFIE